MAIWGVDFLRGVVNSL